MTSAAEQPSFAVGGAISYSLYGFRALSELPLPVPALDAPDAAAPRWEFRRGTGDETAARPDGPAAASVRARDGTVIMELHRGPSGTWLHAKGLGVFHIQPDGCRVDVFPAAGVEERALGLVLAGPVAALLLRQAGYPSLHAAAVLTAGGSVAFLGPNGRGKSTLAASLLRRGDTLLTDDVLPLRREGDAVVGMPGLPIMKLWRESAERALASAEELPSLLANVEKKLLALGGRYAFAQTAAPLRALYLLARYDPVAAGDAAVSVEPLGPREAFTTLLAHTAQGPLIPPEDAARSMPLYAQLVRQAPVRILRYPNGFEYLEEVHARLRAELGPA